VPKIEEQMNQISADIKTNYENWKVRIVADLLGDNYKTRMEKRIIDNDDFFDNLITVRNDKNVPVTGEAALFLKIRSTFDKSIMLYLGESLTWKRFAEFPLPNEASIL
jgi:hypothetical protein